jgi:hypothetical protein
MIKEQNGIELQVSKLYSKSRFFKKLAFMIGISNVMLVMLLGANYWGGSLVIMQSEGNLLSYRAVRDSVPITEVELKKVAENFIKRRYEWVQFDLGRILDGLNSITTSGLKEKIESDLRKDAESYKTISQYVGKIEFTVTPTGEVVGKFDKILRLTARPKDGGEQVSSLPEKIPLLSEAQIALKIVKGARTDDNPLGLYVNSVAEYGATH